MAVHNVPFQMERANFGEAFQTFADAEGNAGLVFASSVPTDGDSGYRKGCLLVNTDLSDESDALYINIGTATSCNFNAATVAGD